MCVCMYVCECMYVCKYVCMYVCLCVWLLFYRRVNPEAALNWFLVKANRCYELKVVKNIREWWGSK